MLKLNNVSVRYDSINALTGVSLEAADGCITGIIGANGAGKSTCLKALSGLVPVCEGEIIYRGRVINKLPVEQRVALGIAHVMEGRRIFGNQSVEDNLLIGAYLRLKRGDKAGVSRDIEEMYGRFPILQKRRRQMAGTLSGGEQQMLVIGKALMSRPGLLLLDEPSLGLAPKIVEEVFSFIKGLRKTGLTIVLVEQLATMTLEVADHVFVFERGKVVASGTPGELAEKGADHLMGMYFGKS